MFNRSTLILLILAAMVALPMSVALAAPEACSTVSEVTSGAFVYKNSAPVRGGTAHTSPIVRFRHDPTLLFKGRNFPGSTCKILDSAGTKVGSCPRQSADGFAGGRCRCAYQNERMTEAVRRAAVRNTDSPEVFFKIGTSGKCVRVPDAGKCYGSSKGLCSKTLK